MRYTPAAWRRYERLMRHRSQRYVYYHQTEAGCFQTAAVQRMYPAVFSWWGDVEVTYDFHAPLLPVGAYLYWAFWRDELRPGLEVAFRSEWAFCVAKQLLYAARAGGLS